MLNVCSWNGQLRPSPGRGLAIEGAILLAAQDPTGSCWPCQGCSASDHWHQAFDCQEGLAICPERSPLISQLLALWPQHHLGFQAQGPAEIVEGPHRQDARLPRQRKNSIIFTLFSSSYVSCCKCESQISQKIFWPIHRSLVTAVGLCDLTWYWIMDFCSTSESISHCGFDIMSLIQFPIQWMNITSRINIQETKCSFISDEFDWFVDDVMWSGIEELNLHVLENQYHIMDLINCECFSVTFHDRLIEYHVIDSYSRDESLIYLRWVGVVCLLVSQMSLCGLSIRSYVIWNLNH